MKLRRLAPPAASAALPSPSPPPRHQAPGALQLPSAQAPSKKRRVSPSPPKTATPVPPPPPALATSAPAAAFLSPYSLPQGDTTTEPAYVDSPRRRLRPRTKTLHAVASGHGETRPVARRPVLAREARKMKRTGTLAARKAAVGELPAGKNAALDEMADEEQNARKIEAEELPSGFNVVDVDETLLGSAQKPCWVRRLWGGTLIGKPVANTDSDACEAEELASTSIGKEEFGISDRAERQRRMTEVFVCGLDNDMKEEDVRLFRLTWMNSKSASHA
ncbi:unnamed protein product [Miscanthus lutarioriparius]|uniref:Uncharacterized protein n=1 Tax=Miscanthus lutarioriparius TaxID=422564 RepID=A0A811SRD7_9POAL|nr:unnamed protein product [Miscanthus lutarioriparius]